MISTGPRMRRACATVALVAAAGGTAIALAPTASAAGYSVAYTGGDGVALRSAPTAGARLSPLVVWRDGTPLTILCQTWSADGVGPRANHVFDRIAYPPRADATWVPDAYVAGTAAANQFTPGIPRCDAATPPPASSAADRAIAWMTVRTGSTQFDGYCLAAVYQAYLSAGRDITAGLPQQQARDSAFTYWSVARGRHPGDRNPPRGALVFFRSPSGGAPGHVAIALGDGRMISTYDGRTHGIHVMPISSYAPALYLGWASA